RRRQALDGVWRVLRGGAAVALIQSHRPTREDMRVWRERERMDRLYVERCSSLLDRLEAPALDEIRAFAGAGPCYVGVSWGKDSTVLAHLVARLDRGLPLVWYSIPGGPRPDNPDCVLVRDAFLAHFGHAVRYDEIVGRNESPSRAAALDE